VTPLFRVGSSSSSRSSGPRREDPKKSFLSAQSAGIEGQLIDDGVNIMKVGVRQLQWEEKYLLLKQFQHREGHCSVPRSYTEDGVKLGQWVNDQRSLKKKGKIDPDREKRLKEINFEWVLVLPSATWDEMYARLKQFKKREGHCNVPQSHAEDGANLGAWVSKQRELKKKGRLDSFREKQLQESDFEWTILGTWDEMYSLLEQFKTREGHCNVPQSHTEDGANLGKSVSHQRHLKKEGKLDPEREKRLEEIGFQWMTSATWDEMYALLQQFKEREGHCTVPQSHKEDDANLGVWGSDQRRLKSKGKLHSDRKARLEEIGFEWVLPSAAWDDMYALLKQFLKREGHCNVPTSQNEDGATLGTWVRDQRQLKRKEKLNQDREKRLEEISFEWAISVPWEDMLSLLKNFKKREGHCNVPHSHTEDGANLGTWVSRQRHLKTKEKLNPDRQKRLEEIDFEWVCVLPSATWDETHDLLKQFNAREGHCDVPQSHIESGINLGRWVKDQRQLKKKEKLDPDREKRLEATGFEWVLPSPSWDKMFALLQQFKTREGHCSVAMRHTEDGIKLGVWVGNQRQLKRKQKLDPDREKRLEEIGFEWVLPLAAWDNMFALLKQFKKREGHCSVPTSHKEDGSNLATWISTQRRLEKIGKLDPDRQKLLDDFGFKWAREAKAP
jgi:hypothetical protein